MRLPGVTPPQRWWHMCCQMLSRQFKLLIVTCWQRVSSGAAEQRTSLWQWGWNHTSAGRKGSGVSTQEEIPAAHFRRSEWSTASHRAHLVKQILASVSSHVDSRPGQLVVYLTCCPHWQVEAAEMQSHLSGEKRAKALTGVSSHVEGRPVATRCVTNLPSTGRWRLQKCSSTCQERKGLRLWQNPIGRGGGLGLDTVSTMLTVLPISCYIFNPYFRIHREN